MSMYFLVPLKQASKIFLIHTVGTMISLKIIIQLTAKKRMVNMHFSQQFCRLSNSDSANHITLKMRVVENIIQYYAFSR